MSISLYSATVPVFKQILLALSDVLRKAEMHAQERKIDPTFLLQSRLFPDMLPLVRQVQIACDFAKGVPARFAGIPQFFFHVTTAYNLLRHNGVEIG